jgi:hypothetical protein
VGRISGHQNIRRKGGAQMNKLINIQNKIFEIRGQKVMIDKDIAELYGISTKVLNQAVKRNIERFPADFMFQLAYNEIIDVQATRQRKGSRSQIVTLKRGQNIKHLPYVFTRNGVNMLATVLRSRIAVQRSIFIMRAFSVLEEAIGKRKQQLLSSPQVIKQLSIHSKAIMRLFKETNINYKQISILKGLQEELAKLIQKIIITSIK